MLPPVEIEVRWMNVKDIMSLPGSDNPVLCADGKVGVLMHFPAQDGLCGVYVPGEGEARWIPAAELSASRFGALKHNSAPSGPDAASSAAQASLAQSWTKLWHQTQR